MFGQDIVKMGLPMNAELDKEETGIDGCSRSMVRCLLFLLTVAVLAQIQ